MYHVLAATYGAFGDLCLYYAGSVNQRGAGDNVPGAFKPSLVDARLFPNKRTAMRAARKVVPPGEYDGQSLQDVAVRPGGWTVWAVQPYKPARNDRVAFWSGAAWTNDPQLAVQYATLDAAEAARRKAQQSGWPPRRMQGVYIEVGFTVA